jgi:glycosyltransferase involved in cell wall biosynthesis
LQKTKKLNRFECKRIGIICGYAFPEGMAATSRILAYAKALNEIGICVDIYIYQYSENTKSNYPVNGEIDGVNYHYPNRRTWSGTKFERFFLDSIKTWLITFINIRKEHKKRKFDSIFISSDYINILTLFIPLFRFIKIKPVFITDEYPIPIRLYLKNKIPIYKRAAYKLILRYASGMIFMTQSLSEYFNNIVKRKSYIMTSVIDFPRFNNIAMKPLKINNKRYICYMGNMELSKDNVDNIINAFALIKHKYGDLDLFLYGQPTDKDNKILTDLIEELSLNDRVFFKGRINYSEVPSVLLGAEILVASQPKTKRAEGGFPTKLGEYLAAGRPVLLTQVGEIDQYIEDSKNGYLCEPENPVAFASKLSFILENYKEAQIVALKGREYVMSHFESKKVATGLVNFLDSL